MARFVYYKPGSFFHIGRSHRDQLVETHGRLDPLIKDLIRDEMDGRWWRYLLVSLPLAWCGMWVGGWFGLALAPLFGCACVMAVRRSKPLFLLYAAPAVAMLALHAAVANHYTRYNLILIGPFAVGAAWILAQIVRRQPGARRTSQCRVPDRPAPRRDAHHRPSHAGAGELDHLSPLLGFIDEILPKSAGVPPIGIPPISASRVDVRVGQRC